MHSATNLETATMAIKMATQWSNFKQSIAIQKNNLLMDFNRIVPVDSPKIVYSPKTCSQQTRQTWEWQLGKICMDEIPQGKRVKEPCGTEIAYSMC